jgi:diguanylate cyclase (GGDEF)-like protein
VVAENKPTTRIQELSDGRVIALKYQPMSEGGWVATHEDVTEQRRIQEQMAYMAHHDALTDLANRVRLRECLNAALSGAGKQQSVAVLCLDLDRFKEVNDTLGHPVGDALLKSVATQLRSCVRDTDTVARLGGDEFAIVQVGANQPMDATVLATRIIEIIGAPHDIDGQQVLIGTSIGIAVSPGDGATGDDLLKSADLALYRAKSEGRGAHRFFEREMDERMRARRNLERDLRQALANHEFELHYQPIIDVKRKEVMAFEALLRWNHPERGRVSPADFIPTTEETGLIIPIGEWVLRQACADAARWPADIGVAVNLSSVQFKSANLVGAVSNALSEAMLRADRLELEITETVLLNDSARTLAMLHELRALGVHISMDDFGTGYSSLSYLQSFPFDKIKIDQSFIRNINQNSQSRAIVHAVAGLGVSLGVSTTAEGVETQEQFELVRAEGLTEVQGFYFSKPIPAQEIPAFLSTLSPARAA